jgi:hypothetical protein
MITLIANLNSRLGYFVYIDYHFYYSFSVVDYEVKRMVHQQVGLVRIWLILLRISYTNKKINHFTFCGLACCLKLLTTPIIRLGSLCNIFAVIFEFIEKCL